jgi:hypothetical protein
MNSNSKTRNIIIGVIVVVLVVLGIIFLGKGGTSSDEAQEPAPTNTDTSSNINTPAPVVIPMPAENSWTTKSIKSDISFEIPDNYYISYPRIDGCDSVASIGTQTAGAPVVSVVLIYKKGCVTNTDVSTGVVRMQEKNGYIFQTNSGSASVLAVFDRIVASAK